MVGGIGGFFARRCVEVEAQAAPARRRPPAHTPAMPAGRVFDAYDAAPAPPSVAAFEDELARAPRRVRSR